MDTSELLANALDGLADKLVGRDHLLKMMPEKFYGDVLQYPQWIQSSESIIELNATTVSQQMFFLGKCTSGEAHAAIQGVLTLITEEAWPCINDMVTNISWPRSASAESGNGHQSSQEMEGVFRISQTFCCTAGRQWQQQDT